MPLLKSRKKTSEFFSETIKSLKSMLEFRHGGDGQAIATQPACHAFSFSRRKIPGKDDACCSMKPQKKISDEFYSDRWMMDDDQGYDDQDLIISTSMQDKVIVVSSSNNTNEQCLKTKKHQQHDAEKREEMNKQGGIRSSSSSCMVISQRMKELEMMEFKDVEHVLDVEEVLHYYSRLRSPIYLDIVNSFFTDMYAELLHKPQRGCSHDSKRRPLGLGPVKKLRET